VDEATVGVRYLLAFVMLAGAIPSDLRTRRVANSWWVPFGVLAALLAASDLADPARDWRALAIAYGAAAVVAGLMYGFWYFHLFGGADAKALMVLAFLAPWPSPHATAAVQPALDALANGSLLMLAVPVVLLVWNLLHGDVRLPAMLLGRPVPLAAARRAQVWPMQGVDAEGTVGWRLWRRAALDDLESEYDALDRAGVQRVWVTAKVPFLIPLAGGVVVAWLVGDLPALAVRLLLNP
jgi:preflagellin peptidase FlaK